MMIAIKAKIEFKIKLSNYFFYIFPDRYARAYRHLLTQDETNILNLRKYNEAQRNMLKLIERERIVGEVVIAMSRTGTQQETKDEV